MMVLIECNYVGWMIEIFLMSNDSVKSIRLCSVESYGLCSVKAFAYIYKKIDSIQLKHKSIRFCSFDIFLIQFCFCYT